MATACEVWFYHLERSSLDDVLPELLDKTLQRKWRALVKCGAPERLESLDTWLWTCREDGFLPHGLASEPFADHQPVLLTTEDDNANGAQVLFLVEGAAPGDLSPYERCIVLFDGRDEAALAGPRTLWKSVKARKLPASYWRQGEQRGWEKQA
ncbi:MAG: DNA polymerase III subunit chi [Caulobacter sp.]|nr:DNA polymerase III subunit chi [Caulobacter sp.]